MAAEDKMKMTHLAGHCPGSARTLGLGPRDKSGPQMEEIDRRRWQLSPIACQRSSSRIVLTTSALECALSTSKSTRGPM